MFNFVKTDRFRNKTRTIETLRIKEILEGDCLKKKVASLRWMYMEDCKVYMIYQLKRRNTIDHATLLLIAQIEQNR